MPHPILIVQADHFNGSRIQTALALAITSNLDLAAAPGNACLPKQGIGLPRPSVINVSQMITLDKRFLTKRIGHAPNEILDEVDKGLLLVLGIKR